MSSRGWQLRVQDILQAISSIQERTAGITFEEFAADEMLFDSILYKLGHIIYVETLHATSLQWCRKS
ncbi:HepT-like ribonuclease domain-containing protein [Coleofasciculus sp. E1-EBD-02]|uniref:HepT-like ribonuclease domain-containing protein n=1 Tax=Coleofasciculus sp. E1-EBD-02 TaxID=3068481 RepID=UPI003305423B